MRHKHNITNIYKEILKTSEIRNNFGELIYRIYLVDCSSNLREYRFFNVFVEKVVNKNNCYVIIDEKFQNYDQSYERYRTLIDDLTAAVLAGVDPRHEHDGHMHDYHHQHHHMHNCFDFSDFFNDSNHFIGSKPLHHHKHHEIEVGFEGDIHDEYVFDKNHEHIDRIDGDQIRRFQYDDHINKFNKNHAHVISMRMGELVDNKICAIISDQCSEEGIIGNRIKEYIDNNVVNTTEEKATEILSQALDPDAGIIYNAATQIAEETVQSMDIITIIGNDSIESIVDKNNNGIPDEYEKNDEIIIGNMTGA